MSKTENITSITYKQLPIWLKLMVIAFCIGVLWDVLKIISITIILINGTL